MFCCGKVAAIILEFKKVQEILCRCTGLATDIKVESQEFMVLLQENYSRMAPIFDLQLKNSYREASVEKWF